MHIQAVISTFVRITKWYALLWVTAALFRGAWLDEHKLCVYLAPTCCKGHCHMQSTTCSTRHRDPITFPYPKKAAFFHRPIPQ